MSNEQARQDALQVAEEVLDWYKTVDNDKADRALQIVRQALALPTADQPNLSDPAVQKRLATQWGYVSKAEVVRTTNALIDAGALPTAAPVDEREAFEAELAKLPSWAPEYEQHRPWVNALLWLIWQARATLPPATLPLLSDDEMPPLPEVEYWSTRDDDTPLFTADQLRARDRAFEAAVRKQMGMV